MQEIFGNPEKYLPVIDYCEQIIGDYGEMESWLDVVDAEPTTHNLCKAIILKSVEKNSVSKLFKPNLIVGRWALLVEILKESENWDTLIELAIRDLGLTEIVLEGSFNKELGSLYSSLIRNKADQEKKFIDWLIKGLEKITQGDWLTELRIENNCAELLIDLIKSRHQVNLTVPFQDALADHAKEVLQGQTTPDYLADFWEQLPNALAINDRVLLKKKQLDLLENAQDINPNYFTFYGGEISDPKLIKDYPNFVRKVISPLIIEKCNTQGLDWLIGLIEKDSKLFINYPQPEDVEDMKHRIKKEYKNNSCGPEAPKLKKLAHLLQIDLEENTLQLENIHEE